MSNYDYEMSVDQNGVEVGWSGERLHTAGDMAGFVSDAISDLLYYSRKEDDQCPVGRIEHLIERGDMAKQDFINLFVAELDKMLP